MAKNIKDLETKLWQSANALRGNMSAEEYMHTILGILSLKYISDRYKKGINRLMGDGLNLESIDKSIFYTEYHSFIVDDSASWEYVMQFANSPKLGEVLDSALIKLEEDNEMLRGIFSKNFNREGMDQVKLGEVIKIFSDEDFSGDDDEDVIGRIYEYFLGKFFRDRGQGGGEFYTPTSIVKLMVNILKPLKGTIYDPACGSGGILVQSKRYILSHGGDINNVTVYGQEYNNVTWKLAKLNLLLNGFSLFDTDQNGVLGQTSGDTFTNDQHKNKKFDYIMANPPFNQQKWGFDKLKEDSRWKWGTPPSGNANYAWLSHIVSKLSKCGKAAVILSNGSLSSTNKEEVKIRENFIKNNLVEAIIELPDKLFYTTGIPASIWFFNKNKTTKNLLMISGSTIEGNMIDKKLRELKSEDIKKITEVFESFRSQDEINIPGFAISVNQKRLEENDFSFVPGRYISIIKNDIDKAETRKEIKNLSEDLFKLLDEFNDLVPKVKNSIEYILKDEDDK